MACFAQWNIVLEQAILNSQGFFAQSNIVLEQAILNSHGI